LESNSASTFRVIGVTLLFLQKLELRTASLYEMRALISARTKHRLDKTKEIKKSIYMHNNLSSRP